MQRLGYGRSTGSDGPRFQETRRSDSSGVPPADKGYGSVLGLRHNLHAAAEEISVTGCDRGSVLQGYAELEVCNGLNI